MLLEVCLSLVALVVGRAVWRRWQYDLHKIPTPSASPVPWGPRDVVTGSGEGEMNRYVGRKWKELGEPKIFKLTFGGRSMVYVRDMDCAKNVVMSKTNPFPKTAAARSLVETLNGNDPSAKGLVKSLEVTPYVKAVRKVYAIGLQSNCLKAAMPKLHNVMNKMVEIIDAKRQKGPVDFQELCVKMTLDAIGVVALNANLGGLDGSRRIYEFVVESALIARVRTSRPFQTFLFKHLPFLKGAREQQKTLDELNAEWNALTREILTRDDPPGGEHPIWHALRTMTDPETGQTIDYESLLSEVASTVVAGMDTTGHQLPLILALLASYPNAVEKLVEELKEHGLYGPGCRTTTLEDLGELSYLSAVVKEGMRVSYILIQTFERETPEDMTILGYRVPKGTRVVVPGNRWLNSETEWDDPEVFKPERWLSGEDMSQKYYLPFSCGPRDCVGQKLANTEMRLAIVRLIQTYDLTPTCAAEELLKNGCDSFTIQVPDGIWLNAIPRA